MFSQFQVNNHHVSTRKADRLYREIENDQAAIKESIEDIKDAVQAVKTQASKVWHDPVSALTEDLQPLKIINTHPLESALLTVGIGFLCGKLMWKQKLPESSASQASTATASSVKPLAPIVAKLEQELSTTATLILEGLFQKVRVSTQRMFDESPKNDS